MPLDYVVSSLHLMAWDPYTVLLHGSQLQSRAGVMYLNPACAPCSMCASYRKCHRRQEKVPGAYSG